MSAMASQITGASIGCSTGCSSADRIKHQSSASLAFVREIQPVTGGFPPQRANNAENVSTWLRRYAVPISPDVPWELVVESTKLHLSFFISQGHMFNYTVITLPTDDAAQVSVWPSAVTVKNNVWSHTYTTQYFPHIEAETIWPPFCRQHFTMHFLNKMFELRYENFTEFRSLESHSQ